MGFASADLVDLRQVKETVPGTTPTTPALKEVRWAPPETLNYSLQNVVSNEMRSDRSTSDLIKVQSDAGGDINYELSYEGHEDFLIAGLAAGAFSAAINISATDIAAVNATNKFTSTTTDFTAENISVGQWVKVGGMTETANSGYFRVVSFDATNLVVSGGTLADEAAGDTVTMVGSMIQNGTTLDSFTLQKFLSDADTPTYFNMTGASVNVLNQTIAVGQPISGSFGFMGFGVATATSQFAGATTPAAATNDVMNAVDNIASVYLDGVASTTCFNSLTIQLTNNIRNQRCVGSLAASGSTLGSIDLTGSIDMFFKDSTMYDRYINSTAFSVAWRVEDNAGNAYVFTLPKVKLETGDLSASGRNTDMVMSSNWRGLRDPDSGATIQIDKFAA